MVQLADYPDELTYMRNRISARHAELFLKAQNLRRDASRRARACLDAEGENLLAEVFLGNGDGTQPAALGDLCSLIASATTEAAYKLGGVEFAAPGEETGDAGGGEIVA